MVLQSGQQHCVTGKPSGSLEGWTSCRWPQWWTTTTVGWPDGDGSRFLSENGWFNIRKAGKYRKIDQHPLSSKIKLSVAIHHLLPDHSWSQAPKDTARVFTKWSQQWSETLLQSPVVGHNTWVNHNTHSNRWLAGGWISRGYWWIYHPPGNLA